MSSLCRLGRCNKLVSSWADTPDWHPDCLQSLSTAVQIIRDPCRLSGKYQHSEHSSLYTAVCAGLMVVFRLNTVNCRGSGLHSLTAQLWSCSKLHVCSRKFSIPAPSSCVTTALGDLPGLCVARPARGERGRGEGGLQWDNFKIILTIKSDPACIVANVLSGSQLSDSLAVWTSLHRTWSGQTVR